MSNGSNNQGTTSGHGPGWRGRSARGNACRFLAVLSLSLLPLFSITLPAQGRGPASASRLPGASITNPADAHPADATEPGDPLADPARDEPGSKTSQNTTESNRSSSSVRPRGAEAPRTVVTPTVTPAPPPTANRTRRVNPDLNPRQVTGQSAPLISSPDETNNPSRSGSSDEGTSSRQSTATPDIRLWPIKAGRFTFTQGFGCVRQIGNFYQANPECPAGSPVVHTGIDLAAPEGTPFYAAASGWVTEAGLDRATGLANTRIVIQHDGKNDRYATEYLHWISSFVEVGDYVEAGEPIAEVGSVGYSTGPHLHFGVTDLNTGSSINPLDWLPENRSVGDYQTIEPNAKRQTFKNRSSGTPDYADPAPPPAPKRVPVPESPKANQDERQKSKQAGGEASDETSARHDRRKERRTDERKAERRTENAATTDAETGDQPKDGAATTDKRVAKRGRDADKTSTAKRDEPSPEGTPTPAPAENGADGKTDQSRKDRNNNGGGNDRDPKRDRNDSSAKDGKQNDGKNGNQGANNGATDQNSKDDPKKDQADGGKNPAKNNRSEREHSATDAGRQDISDDPVEPEPTPTPEPTASDDAPAEEIGLEEEASPGARPDPEPEQVAAPDKTTATRPDAAARNSSKPEGAGKKQR